MADPMEVDIGPNSYASLKRLEESNEKAAQELITEIEIKKCKRDELSMQILLECMQHNGKSMYATDIRTRETPLKQIESLKKILKEVQESIQELNRKRQYCIAKIRILQYINYNRERMKSVINSDIRLDFLLDPSYFNYGMSPEEIQTSLDGFLGGVKDK